MRTLRFVLAAALLAGCAAHQHGSIDGGVLGRVVIYRNGVAFYERTARVIDGKVTVHVPRDRVDDFLKSLTVVDRRTNKPLMVTIPRQQSSEGQYLEMTLETPEVAAADVMLTYVTESPAWKPSYRVVVGTNDKVMLEGWAIVDNTTNEDWNRVLVGVGASSALAFRYDLWSVRTVDRDLLARDDKFAIAPPTAVSPYESNDKVAITGDDLGVSFSGSSSLENSYYVDGVNTTGRTFESTLGAAAGSQGETIEVKGEVPMIDQTSTTSNITVSHGYSRDEFGGFRNETVSGIQRSNGSSGPSAKQIADEQAKQETENNKALIKKVLTDKKEIVVDMRGPVGDSEISGVGEQIKNKLVDAGMPAEKIHVVTTLAPETASRQSRVLSVTPQVAQVAEHKAATQPRNLVPDTPEGESNFMADRPMTVKAGTSAMVSMLRNETPGGVVYLYDPISSRGDQRFAFKAVRLVNPTTETLEPGPVTVYGSGRFVGEGITEAVLPHAAVVVPFALDKQVVVEQHAETVDRLAKVMTVQRGIMTAEIQHRRNATFVVTNRGSVPARVYLRHHLAEGWTFVGETPKMTRTGGDELFEVDVAAGATETVAINEATPLERALDLQNEATVGMMQVYVDDPEASLALKAQLTAVLATHRAGAELNDKIATLREQLEEYRERGADLEHQLVSLKGMRSGNELAASLRSKSAEIAQKAQQMTIAIVNAQEQLMQTRVKLANQLADLHLTDVTKETVSRR
ncbi:MAG TPA: hypothetical protein VGM90_30495 [Kofleriaceae bacterium]